MHPELEAIVDADRTARRDVENARIRLAALESGEIARLSGERETAAAAARAQLESDVRAIEAEGRRAADRRRAAREALRANRRALAVAAIDAAVAEYVRVVRGAPGRGAGP